MGSHKLSPSIKGDWHLLVGGWDDDLAEWLRDNVPASARQWMAVTKAWRIGNDYVDVVRERIERDDDD